MKPRPASRFRRIGHPVPARFLLLSLTILFLQVFGSPVLLSRVPRHDDGGTRGGAGTSQVLSGSISGMKFYDVNGNGLRELATDYGLPGWKIRLSGPVVDSTVTDASGNYSFSGLPDGSYTVSEELRPGWIRTFPPFPGTYSVTIAGGGSTIGKIFGNYPQGVIRGTKYNDLNGNGGKDSAEPSLSGWIIKLTGLINAVDTTDQNGTYEFLGLVPGTYTVQESLALRPGWVATAPASGQYSVDVVVGTRDTLDFGNFQLGSIHGKKRHDARGDSSLAGDTTLNGWVVKLYKAGVYQAERVTSDSGYYKFTGIGPGVYSVEESLKAGWVQTFPQLASPGVVPGLGTNAGRRAYSVSMISGSDTGRDFGNFKGGTISGKKYRDLLGDSSLVGDSTINGWVVKLYTGTTLVDRSVTSDSGFYRFNNVGPGVYTVEESLQVGWAETYPRPGAAGVVARVDTSNAPRAYSVTIDSAGKAVTLLDFGNFKGARISGRKFTDVLHDSSVTADPPIKGWTVKLFKGSTLQLTAVTGDSGDYVFAGITPGTYTVEEVLQTGWLQTYPRVSTAGVVSPAGSTSGPRAYRVVVDSSGKLVPNRDFGNFKLGIVSGSKYNDVAVDSSVAGDTTLRGWMIKIFNGSTVVAETVTNNSGNYTLRNLLPGTYTLEESSKVGWSQSFPRLASAGVVAPVQAIDGRRAYRIVIDSSGRSLTHMDFGNFEVPVIAGKKFDDLNGNGVRDSAEPGIAGWRILLTGARRDSLLTDVNGDYVFANLAPGKYLVRETGQAGWVQTSANPDSITINRSGAATAVDFGNFRLVSIGGTKYKDITADSAVTPDDLPVTGWVVRLFKDSSLVGSTSTNGAGVYTFNNVGPGAYTVEETLRVGWRQTVPRLGSANVVGPIRPADSRRAYLIHPVSGQNQTTLDFANYPIATISGRAFQDGYPNTYGNGHEDPGEPGLQGWVILLQGPVAPRRDTTDALGHYAFTDLPAGSYTLSELPQGGWIQTDPPQTSPDYPVVLSEGRDTTGFDFGDFSLGIISGIKFSDGNSNAKRDSAEPVIPGWHMYLSRGGIDVDSTVTDNSGAYKFIAVGPGPYTLHEEMRPGWIPTLPNPSGSVSDTMQVNGLDTVIFGNFSFVNISGFVYEDSNANGRKDSAERGLQGWAVHMAGSDPANDTTVMTDSLGRYRITGFPNDLVTVSEEVPAGWTPTNPALPVYHFSIAGGQVEDTLDFGNFTDTTSFRTFTQTDFAMRPAYLNRHPAPTPNPGNVRAVTYVKMDWYHKKGTPDALVLGIPRKDSAKTYGWATFDHLQNRLPYFLPQTGPSRGFDRYAGRIWIGARHTPSIRFYDSHIAGELYALKYNIGASDAGVTGPGLGDLLFNDTSAYGNPGNGRSIRSIVRLCDSAMTYYKMFDTSYYNKLDTCLTRINRAFVCDMDVARLSPLTIRGCGTLRDVPYLRPNPHPGATSHPRIYPEESSLPEKFVLFQNYPNPFNPVTTIEYLLSSPAVVTLRVYNVLGQKVASLLEREAVDEGRGGVDFNASKLASGVYFYRLTVEVTPDNAPTAPPEIHTSVKKLLLLK